MRISRSLAIGCILCCVSKTAILLAGGGALLGTSVFATGQGAQASRRAAAKNEGSER